jgi:hypothetical protein
MLRDMCECCMVYLMSAFIKKRDSKLFSQVFSSENYSLVVSDTKTHRQNTAAVSATVSESHRAESEREKMYTHLLF